MPPTAQSATDLAVPTATERKPMKLPLVFLFGFLASLVVVGGLIWFFAAYEGGNLWPFAYNPRINQDKWFEVIRNAVTTAAALGVGITLFFSYRRQQTAEHNQRVAVEAQLTAARAQETAAAALELSTKQHTLDQDRRKDAVTAELRTRYAQTAEQLGSNHLAVRLAGVYSMAALADDWAAIGNQDERQVCIDLLCAYFRSDQPGEVAAGTTELADATLQVITERIGAATSPRKFWGSSRIRLKGGGRLPSLSRIRLARGGQLSILGTSAEHVTYWRNIQLDGQLDISDLRLGRRPLNFINMDVAGGGSLWMTLQYDDGNETSRIRFSRLTLNGGLVWINAPGCQIEFEHCVFKRGSMSIDTKWPIRKEDGGDSVTFRDCVFETDVFKNGPKPDKNMSPTTGLTTASLEVSDDCRFENGATVLVSWSPDRP